uniref:Uncharacterized protein n=1 Tax=Triticum urartu TaxID=4572 RepID=A0A8R7Q4V5_TRIUA
MDHGLVPDDIDALRPHAVDDESPVHVPPRVHLQPGHGVQVQEPRRPAQSHVPGAQAQRDGGEAEHARDDGIGVVAGLQPHSAVVVPQPEDAAERLRRGHEGGEGEVPREHGHHHVAELPQARAHRAAVSGRTTRGRGCCVDAVAPAGWWRGGGGKGGEQEDDGE